MTTDATDSFTRLRLAAADHAFETYNFGETDVDATGNWEWQTPGTEVHRSLHLVVDDHHGPETERAYFVVRFEDAHSSDVRESYATTAHGGLFGAPAASS